MEYKVIVSEDATLWYKPGTDERHREDGPAVEYANGSKFWYLDGVYFTEAEFNLKMNSCEGKIVEIDGQTYRLTLEK